MEKELNLYSRYPALDFGCNFEDRNIFLGGRRVHAGCHAGQFVQSLRYAAVRDFFRVNMALVMGILLLLAKSTNMLPESLRLLLTVGFLGGFTTFSSFSMETLTLINGGSIFLALVNVCANLLLGFGAAILGLHIVASMT